MPLSWNEIRSRAITFSKAWSTEPSKRAEGVAGQQAVLHHGGGDACIGQNRPPERQLGIDLHEVRRVGDALRIAGDREQLQRNTARVTFDAAQVTVELVAQRRLALPTDVDRGAGMLDEQADAVGQKLSRQQRPRCPQLGFQVAQRRPDGWHRNAVVPVDRGQGVQIAEVVQRQQPGRRVGRFDQRKTLLSAPAFQSMVLAEAPSL